MPRTTKSQEAAAPTLDKVFLAIAKTNGHPNPEEWAERAIANLDEPAADEGEQATDGTPE